MRSKKQKYDFFWQVGQELLKKFAYLFF